MSVFHDFELLRWCSLILRCALIVLNRTIVWISLWEEKSLLLFRVLINSIVCWFSSVGRANRNTRSRQPNGNRAPGWRHGWRPHNRPVLSTSRVVGREAEGVTVHFVSTRWHRLHLIIINSKSFKTSSTRFTFTGLESSLCSSIDFVSVGFVCLNNSQIDFNDSNKGSIAIGFCPF